MNKINCQFLILFFILATQGFSQTNPVIDIFPQGTVLHGNIPYHNDDLPKHLLDIYLPANATGKLPLVIFIHGGGWLSNDKYADMGYMKKTVSEIVSRGYALASIDYRFSTQAVFPAQIQDCNRAVSFLYDHADQYGFDRERFAVMGFSAGGHLASLVGLSKNDAVKDFFMPGTNESFSLQAVVDFYGPAELILFPGSNDEKSPEGLLIGAAPLVRPDLAKAASPVTYVDENDPPFLIIHGEKDELVSTRHSQLLSAWLTAKGVENELVIVKDAPHFGSMFDADEVRKKVLNFLGKHLLSSPPPPSGQKKPIVIQDQGSFTVGGSVITNPGTFDAIKRTPEGQTFHGDHAYVFYQIPENARKLPLVFWHGFGQFSKTWETTPDGREGYQNIFLRRDFSVYLLDQPRRGRASRSTVEATITPTPDEQFWFNVFRVGVWPDYFPGVQFAKDTETLNQYFRQMTPNIGGFDEAVITDAASQLFDKIGDGILVTHSHSGGFGWSTAMKNPHVRAIVSYEPGSGFPFPEGEVPAPLASSAGPLAAVGVAKEAFLKLTKIPIIIYYGDNIPAEPDPNPGTDGWRARLEMARLWRDAVNKYGGDVTVVYLPEIGIKGNTHFPFSDLNNVEIADLMLEWLKEKKLD